jgi:PilZ domain-containing protein
VQTRRRSQRVTIRPPILANAAGASAQVVDASLSGVRLSHSAQLAQQKQCAISLEWQGKAIEFVAELRWTHEQRGEYQSGFEIQTIDPAAGDALRGLIDECAARMPLYQRHELVHGVWRTTNTTDSWQPVVGFTVAASESPHAVASFRTAYSTGDARMRERIRRLAELSIAHPERRYDM